MKNQRLLGTFLRKGIVIGVVSFIVAIVVFNVFYPRSPDVILPVWGIAAFLGICGTVGTQRDASDAEPPKPSPEDFARRAGWEASYLGIVMLIILILWACWERTH